MLESHNPTKAEDSSELVETYMTLLALSQTVAKFKTFGLWLRIMMLIASLASILFFLVGALLLLLVLFCRFGMWGGLLSFQP